MPKKIYFDGLNLSLTRGTGIAMYTRVLVNMTRELGYESGVLYSRKFGLPKDELTREVAFFDADMSASVPGPLRNAAMLASYLGSLGGVRAQKVPITGAVITEPLASNWVASDDVYVATRVFDRARALFLLTGRFLKVKFPTDVDLFHWTFPMPLTSNARANIYTIHDIIPVRLPYTSLDWKRYYVRTMREMLKKADHIVTVSEHSKRDIMKYFGVEERRITNTYAATLIPRQTIERSEAEIANELDSMFGLNMRGYLLFYGSLEPKKNVGRIVQAYLASNVDMPLVLVLAQSWLNEDETRLINQAINDIQHQPGSKSRRGIRKFEYMPFRLLTTLIQGAKAVLFPSIYEGFGLPTLEGMILGTPVITSTASSIPEVAGNAAILVDPYSVDAIKNAINSVVKDDDLWSELQRRGRIRAEFFSLAAYRERVGKVYASFV